MGNFSEETFNSWRKPASENEEQKISRAIDMIKSAVKADEILKDKDIEYIIQGSYGNDTNVRLESDVDVCVMLKDTFYSEYPVGKTREDFGFTEGTNNFSDFRTQLEKAIIDKFGKEDVKPGNKSIKITENNYHVEADAVPAFQYRNYKYKNSTNPEKFIEGIKFHTITDGKKNEIINYPKIHIENGKTKNTETQRSYKRTVRIFKRIRYRMIDEKIPVNSGITSFLLECLLWNVPNSFYNDYETWTERINHILEYLYQKTKDEDSCNKWREVSEMFYLFHSKRKWNVEMTNQFLVQFRKYLAL